MSDEYSDVMTRERIDHDEDDSWYVAQPEPEGEPEPTPLELAHLLAELNFLRAQLVLLRGELEARNAAVEEQTDNTVVPG